MVRVVLPSVAALTVALLVLGCGSGSQGDNTQTETQKQPTGAGKFTGQASAAYTLLKKVCGESPPDRLARDLGIQVNTHTRAGIVSIAKEYAKGFHGPSRQASFQGCLAALPNP
jgi:hypothetical protein